NRNHASPTWYSASLASAMSSEAPFPNASNMDASLLTSDTRMGVKLLPSRSSMALVKAAAEVFRAGTEAWGGARLYTAGHTMNRDIVRRKEMSQEPLHTDA
ncbi:hypothetical protein Vafri_814, partial [Volvox africanus]